MFIFFQDRNGKDWLFGLVQHFHMQKYFSEKCNFNSLLPDYLYYFTMTVLLLELLTTSDKNLIDGWF